MQSQNALRQAHQFLCYFIACPKRFNPYDSISVLIHHLLVAAYVNSEEAHKVLEHSQCLISITKNILKLIAGFTSEPLF